jgi:hypothetical protein
MDDAGTLHVVVLAFTAGGWAAITTLQQWLLRRELRKLSYRFDDLVMQLAVKGVVLEKRKDGGDRDSGGLLDGPSGGLFGSRPGF